VQACINTYHKDISCQLPLQEEFEDAKGEYLNNPVYLRGQLHDLPCNLAVNCFFAYETMLMKNFISFSFFNVKGTAAKGEIRIRKSKDRQHNGQIKIENRTHNKLHKTKG
jgi:hypothetical protein